MEKEIAIKVENLSKTFKIPHEKITSLRGAFVNAFHSNGYEEFKALDDVSFEVRKGEFFGIIGRNGSGKSTLLKIMAGIYQPDKGKVKVNGLISPFLELGIGFNPELSGRDNIYLNAAVLGLSHKQIGEKFDDIVDFSELRRFIDQKVKNYSSGMQVRLMFSVAIHANREILLMDEVLAVGDTNFQNKCMAEFTKYRNMGKTVILVTHDIGTVQRYCDKAMLLRNGRVEMMGDPRKVGNEYIYQNMSDEEKRIVEEARKKEKQAESYLKGLKGKNLEKERKRIQEERRKEEEERKNKIAQISKVEFLDKQGQSKNSFLTGEDMTIRVEYLLRKELTNPIFGIVIKDSRHNLAFAFNNEYINNKTGKMESGVYCIDFKIKNLLGTGRYYLSPAVATETGQVIDWNDSIREFQMVNKDYNSTGIVDLDSKIIIKKIGNEG